MSRKQTIIILYYKYTVFRRRDRVQAPAPTAAAGRVHYTRRGGITVLRIRRYSLSYSPPPLPFYLFLAFSLPRTFVLSLPSSHGL